MSVSAIIVSYRTGAVLGRSLGALCRARDVDQVVLVDNGNDVAGEEIIDSARAQFDGRVLVLRGHGNVGFGVGCNRGAAAAGGDHLLFVNPDVVLSEGAAASLVQALYGAARPAVIGGDLRTMDGRPDRGSRRDRVTLWNAMASFAGLTRLGWRDLHRHNDPLPQGPTRVGAVSGALMLMRREDFEAVGGFDEEYFLHVEDIDLCRRIELAGGDVLFAPGPHGLHERSSSEASNRTIEQHKARSFARYFKKFARSPLEQGVAIGAGVVLCAMKGALGSPRP